MHCLCEDGIEKSAPSHHSKCLMVPNGDPQDGFFYTTLTFMIDSYNPVTHHLTFGRSIDDIALSSAFVTPSIFLVIYRKDEILY